MAVEKKGSNSRNYKVLTYYGDQFESNGWHEVAVIEASGAEQAVKLVAAEKGAGRYAAIPERSWSEMNIRVETPAPVLFIDKIEPAKPEVEVETKPKATTAAGATV